MFHRNKSELNDWETLVALSEAPCFQHIIVHTTRTGFFSDDVSARFREKELNLRFLEESFEESR